MAEKVFIPPWAKRFTRSYEFASARRGMQARKLLREVSPRGRRLTLLDGASGTGKFMAGFLPPVLPVLEQDAPLKKVIVADLNDAALRWQCLQKAWSGQVESIAGDLRHLPLDAGSIDLYTLTNALEHMTLPERQGVYREAQRLLARDGILYVAGPIQSAWARIEYRAMKACRLIPQNSIDTRGDDDHEVWFTRGALVTELADAGFALRGEDYYIHGSVKAYWRVKLGSIVQDFLPFSVRKFFGHGAMFTFQKIL